MAEWTSRPLLFPAIMIGAVTLFVGGFALLSLVVSETKVVRSAHRGVDELLVTAHSGDVKLVAAPAGAPLRVVRYLTEGFGSPSRQESFTGGRLRLDSSCDSWPPLDRCDVRYVIAVPPGTRVVATSGDGDVSVEGLASRRRLELTSGSGGLSASDAAAPALTLQSGSGDVAATGVRARALSASSGSGDLVLDLTEAPASLKVDAGSGDVIMTLPDQSYALAAQAPDGGVFNDGIRVDPRSPHRVAIDAGSGEVRLEPSG